MRKLISALSLAIASEKVGRKAARNSNGIKKLRHGEVTEWPKVRHWKCRVGVKPHRGFESRPLRFTQIAFRNPVKIMELRMAI